MSSNRPGSVAQSRLSKKKGGSKMKKKQPVISVGGVPGAKPDDDLMGIDIDREEEQGCCTMYCYSCSKGHRVLAIYRHYN